MTIDPSPSMVLVRSGHAMAPRSAEGIAFNVSTRHRGQRLGLRSLAQAAGRRLRRPDGRDEISPPPRTGDRARPDRSAPSPQPVP
jgi:hypothetical protein